MSAPTPQQSRRRLKILNTVKRHLSQHGYDGLSMRDIAADASVSPTTLYNLFENRDGLILAALEELLTRIGEEVAATNTRGFERYRTRAEVIARQIVATPEYAEAMTRVLFNADAVDPIALALLRDQMSTQEALLKEMRELGEIRDDVDLETWSRVVVGNGWSTVLLWLKGHCALREFADEYVRSHLLTLVPIMAEKLRREHEGLLSAG